MSTPLAYSLPGAVEASGLSRSTLLRAIGTGELRAKKSAKDADGNPVGSWVIPAESLKAFIDNLVDA